MKHVCTTPWRPYVAPNASDRGWECVFKLTPNVWEWSAFWVANTVENQYIAESMNVTSVDIKTWIGAGITCITSSMKVDYRSVAVRWNHSMKDSFLDLDMLRRNHLSWPNWKNIWKYVGKCWTNFMVGKRCPLQSWCRHKLDTWCRRRSIVAKSWLYTVIRWGGRVQVWQPHH